MSGELIKLSSFTCANDKGRPSRVSLHGRLCIPFWAILMTKQALNVRQLSLRGRIPIKRSKHTDSNLQSIKFSWCENLLPLLPMFVQSCPNLCSFTDIPKYFLTARCRFVNRIQSQLSSFWLAIRYIKRIESSPFNLKALCCHFSVLFYTAVVIDSNTLLCYPLAKRLEDRVDGTWISKGNRRND